MPTYLHLENVALMGIQYSFFHIHYFYTIAKSFLSISFDLSFQRTSDGFYRDLSFRCSQTQPGTNSSVMMSQEHQCASPNHEGILNNGFRLPWSQYIGRSGAGKNNNKNINSSFDEFNRTANYKCFNEIWLNDWFVYRYL